MASFNQSPLGQTTLSSNLGTTLVPGSSTVSSSTVAYMLGAVVSAIGNAATWYAPSSAVQSEGRRESKIIGLPPLM